MAVMVKEKSAEGSLKRQLDDILLILSWGDVAEDYFDKSSSWLYQKLKGIDGNGKPTQMNDVEKEQLRGALNDIADRIRRASENIK